MCDGICRRGGSMYQIGVISDTHGMLRGEVKEFLRGCEAILHAGDIDRQNLLEELEQIAPTFAVRGNNDKKWAEALPLEREIEIHGIRIYMIHNRKQIRKDLSAFDLVIFGHSHQYEEERRQNALWLNPGSCGPRRFGRPITMAVLEGDGDRNFHIRKIEMKKEKKQQKSSLPPDIGDQIPSILKAIDAGKDVEAIAKKYGIRPELAEQICRLYLTHPGVSTEGILRKMGL